MDITFVGSTSNTATTAAAYDVTLPAGMLEGDLVVVGYGISNAADSDMVVNTAGYSEIDDLYADDTHDTNLALAYKFMGETPDSVVNVKGPSSSNRGGAAVVQVWRGVDPAAPIDVNAVGVTGVNSATPNPGSITPTTAGAVILVFAAVSGLLADSTGTAPAGYSNLVADSRAGSVDSFTVMAASKLWTGGAEDPGTFTDFAVDGGTPAACSWASITLALRPLSLPIDLVQSSRFDRTRQFFGGSITKPAALAILQEARFDKVRSFFGGIVANEYTPPQSFFQVPVDGLYIDLKISGNDLVIAAGGEPALLDDRDSIAQDIKHLIRESGLMVQIIGQRDPIRVKANLQELELLIEDDVRLIPGTIKITPMDNELYFVAADTLQFGPIEFYIGF